MPLPPSSLIDVMLITMCLGLKELPGTNPVVKREFRA